MARNHRRQNAQESGSLPEESAPENLTEEGEESFLVLSEELRTIYLFGLFNTKLTLRFIKYWDILTFAYNQVLPKRDILTVVIHCGGGSSYDGLALYDKIKSSGIPTQTMCIGKVDSAAIAVFLAGFRRGIYENAFISFHQTQPNLCQRSNRAEVEREIKECRKIDSRYHAIILANSNLGPRTIRRFEREQKEITAEEAVKYGLATEIIKNH